MSDDMRAWLENWGLGQYAASLADHGIGSDVLADLSKDELAGLGLSLGDRLRLIKAIKVDDMLKNLGISLGGRQRLLTAIVAEMDTGASTTSGAPVSSARAQLDVSPPIGSVETSSAPERNAPAPSGDAERRPLTVMFCDLADSTALSTRLDPEDLQDVIRTYQETCTRHIQEYEGFVAKYMGDGILVYFGYPKSLERNAERAVRSALGIVGAMVGLNETLGREKGIEIAVRIGIATGMVMVGEIVGEGMAQERTVIGEAPNVAARLQGLAERNGIVVGSLTRELTGDAFAYTDLGSHELKGISGLVQTWGVTGLREDDGIAAHADDHDVVSAPVLVGRDEEIGLLRRAWQSTKDEGRGQVVTLSGEAGIGKSALIDGLKAEVREEGLPQLTMRCSPYHTNSALYPVIEHFRRLGRWQPEDDAATRLDKLERMLERYAQPMAEAVPLMASLLLLAVPEDRYPALALTPQQQKQQTQDMIVGITMEVAEGRPFLQLWEDLHWADPSTLELIGLLIEQAPTASLLMVLTARPEFVPPWPARSHITPITLNRLERPHAEALVARIAGAKPLPEEVVDHIVTKTDGVPLYVEELTKTILVSDILVDAGERYALTGPLSSVSIPDTLQESLMARLDRLPQVRELAQLGSVLGREFAYEMISGLSTSGDAALRQGLEQLVDAELLYQRGRPPRAKYFFKHALVQDAAYGSLLRRARQQYHQQAAELLEARFPEAVEAHPEIVAHHFSEAGMADRAVEYYLQAGERMSRISASAEAVAHLSKGLEGLATLPDDAERAQRELQVLTTLGPALMVIKGYAAPEVEHTYQRAVELARQHGDPAQQFSSLHGLWYYAFIRSDLHVARGLAEQLVEMTEGRHEFGLELAANRSLGYTLHYLGEFEPARIRLEQVIAAYDPAVHGSYAFRHGGADPGAGCLAQISMTLFILGYPDQAVERIEAGLSLARQLDHPFSETWVLTAGAIVHLYRGEPRQGQTMAESAMAIAADKSYATYLGWASALQNWALAEQGGGGDAIAGIYDGIEASRATGAEIISPHWMAVWAGFHGRNGQAEEGLAAIDDALAQIDRGGEHMCEAEVHRLKGELLLDSDQTNGKAAEACFQRAIEVSKSQAAKSWELRAATSLARLWRDQGKRDEARALLAPVYDWFTEGFDTADLKEAKTLLDVLA